MTSKDAIFDIEFNSATHGLNFNREIEVIKQDLEELEELKKIMGTPIQEIMKRLKLLDILKEFLNDSNTGTGWIEININPNHDVLDSEEHKKKQLLIKEWLENE